jgi:hypothetical protein
MNDRLESCVLEGREYIIPSCVMKQNLGLSEQILIKFFIVITLYIHSQI